MSYHLTTPLGALPPVDPGDGRLVRVVGQAPRLPQGFRPPGIRMELDSCPPGSGTHCKAHPKPEPAPKRRWIPGVYNPTNPASMGGAWCPPNCGGDDPAPPTPEPDDQRGLRRTGAAFSQPRVLGVRPTGPRLSQPPPRPQVRRPLSGCGCG